MNITPETARELLDGATPGPWVLNPYGNILQGDRMEGPVTDVIGLMYRNDPDDTANGELMAAAPDLAQTITGMTEEWGVERDRPGTAYIDGTVARWITWIGDEARARKACVISPRGGNPRLVRRLVGPVEVIDGE